MTPEVVKQANLEQMRSDLNKDKELEIRDLTGDIQLIDPKGTAFYNVLTNRCREQKHTINGVVEWTEDTEKNRDIKIISASGNKITIDSDDRLNLLKYDMLCDYDKGNDQLTYYRVMDSPSNSTNEVTLQQIGYIEENGKIDNNSTLKSISANLSGKTLFKYGNSFPQGTRGGEGKVHNPIIHKNYVHTFRHVVELEDQINTESWMIENFTYENYEIAKALKEHKQEINQTLYISTGHNMPGHKMTKGLLHHPINRIEGVYVPEKYRKSVETSGEFSPDEIYGIDEYDDSMFSVVKGADNVTDDMIILCNQQFLIMQNRMARETTQMVFNPFDKNNKPFGYTIRNLEHGSGNYEVIHDGTLDRLFPNDRIIAFFLDTKKLRYRYLKGKNTTLVKNVNDPNKNMDEIVAHKIRTIGGCLELRFAKCHTYMNLRIKKVA